MKNNDRYRSTSRAGQSVILFAVVLTVLLAILALAIDANREYVTASKEESASRAAALAGVVYMPGDLTTATNVAKTEAARNGFTNGNTSGGHNVVVSVTQPTGTLNELAVSITDNSSAAVFPMLGFGVNKVVQSATAYYVPPIQMGQPGAQMGSDLSSLGTAGNYYFMRTEGWSNPRSEGDPFTPTPNQSANSCGPSGGASCKASPADLHLISSARGTDATSAFSGGITLPSKGGYNYLIWVPAGLSANVQVFNPAFAPDNGIASTNYDYHEYDSSFSPGSTTATDYSAMMYTVFSVASIFTRSSDTAVTSQTYLPYDETIGPGHYKYFNASGTESASQTGDPFDYDQWIDVTHPNSGTGVSKLVTNSHTQATGTGLSGGTTGQYYRIRVDTMSFDGSVPDYSSDSGDSYAHKGYAVRVVNNGTNTVCATCTLSAMDDMTVYTPITSTGSGSSFTIPLFGVPNEYRDQTLAVYLFDVGDVSNGTNEIKIDVPAYRNTSGTTTAASTASQVGINAIGNSLGTGSSSPITPVTSGKADVVVRTSSGVIDNGSWIQMLVTVPADYNPASALYWSLEYDVSGGASAGDTFAVQVSLTGGSPVHLLP